MSLPIAMQVYSMRDEANQDLEKVLRELKDMGYDAVELFSLHGKKPEEVAAICQKVGIDPISAHVPYDEMVADPAGTMKAYATVGCRFVAVPYLTDDKRAGTPAWEAVKENIRMLGAAAKKEGMTLLYHNHDFEFQKTDGEYMLDNLYRTVSADLLETELDTCWVKVGGEDPAAYIEKYSGRCPLVHLKDFSGNKNAATYQLIGMEGQQRKNVEETEKFSLRPVGSGVQDMPAIIDAAIKAGAQCLIVEQDNPDEGHTPMQCAKISREYLKSIGY